MSHAERCLPSSGVVQAASRLPSGSRPYKRVRWALRSAFRSALTQVFLDALLPVCGRCCSGGACVSRSALCSMRTKTRTSGKAPSAPCALAAAKTGRKTRLPDFDASRSALHVAGWCQDRFLVTGVVYAAQPPRPLSAAEKVRAIRGCSSVRRLGAHCVPCACACVVLLSVQSKDRFRSKEDREELERDREGSELSGEDEGDHEEAPSGEEGLSDEEEEETGAAAAARDKQRELLALPGFAAAVACSKRARLTTRVCAGKVQMERERQAAAQFAAYETKARSGRPQQRKSGGSSGSAGSAGDGAGSGAGSGSGGFGARGVKRPRSRSRSRSPQAGRSDTGKRARR